MTGLRILMQIHISENVTLCVVSIEKRSIEKLENIVENVNIVLNINFEHFACSFVLWNFP